MEKSIHKPLKNHIGHSTWSEEPNEEQLAEVEKIANYFYNKRRDEQIDRSRRKKKNRFNA